MMIRRSCSVCSVYHTMSWSLKIGQHSFSCQKCCAYNVLTISLVFSFFFWFFFVSCSFVVIWSFHTMVWFASLTNQLYICSFSSFHSTKNANKFIVREFIATLLIFFLAVWWRQSNGMSRLTFIIFRGIFLMCHECLKPFSLWIIKPRIVCRHDFHSKECFICE